MQIVVIYSIPIHGKIIVPAFGLTRSDLNAYPESFTISNMPTVHPSVCPSVPGISMTMSSLYIGYLLLYYGHFRSVVDKGGDSLISFT